MSFNRSGEAAKDAIGKTVSFSDGNYWMGLEVYHALHCLVRMLRPAVLEDEPNLTDRPRTVYDKRSILIDTTSQRRESHEQKRLSIQVRSTYCNDSNADF